MAVPGSKSIANRALAIAALADGDSELVGAARRRRHRGDAATASPASASSVEHSGDDRAWSPGGGRLTAAGRLARRAGRHDVTVRHRDGRARRRPGRRSTATRRCGAGRWPSCTTRSRSLGAEVAYGDEPGHLPVTVTGPLRGGDVSAARRRVQPVHHRADAGRPAPRRRADDHADDAARVGALRAGSPPR